MNPKIKNAIIFIIILVIGIAVYFFFFAKPATKPTLTSGTTGAPVGTGALTTTVSNTVGQEFLTQLLNVKNIKLDDSIFSSDSFNSLKDTTDTSLTLSSPGDEGRINPFSPVGSDIVASVAPSVTVTILPPASVVTPPASLPAQPTNTNNQTNTGTNAGIAQ